MNFHRAGLLLMRTYHPQFPQSQFEMPHSCNMSKLWTYTMLCLNACVPSCRKVRLLSLDFPLLGVECRADLSFSTKSNVNRVTRMDGWHVFSDSSVRDSCSRQGLSKTLCLEIWHTSASSAKQSPACLAGVTDRDISLNRDLSLFRAKH